MTPTPAYLDHAASTPVRPEVLEAMVPYLAGRFGNPSSAHAPGRAARAGLEQARRQVAAATGVEPSEVYFTSGGTEADNLAILGRAHAARRGGAPFAVAAAATEHKAVLAAAHAVAAQGGREILVPVDAAGLVDPQAVTAALAARPAVLSVMWVNNETGVEQPVEALAAEARDAGVPFHTDMVQAFGKVSRPLGSGAIQLASLSGHKIGAAKGIGALLARQGVALEPLVTGGGQQREVRPGTENIAGAVGLGVAAELAAAEADAEQVRLAALREELLAGLRAAVPDLVVPAAEAPRAAHVLAVLVPEAESGPLQLQLDQAGVAVSGGSACTTGAPEPSHVLLAMGIPAALARGLVRFSLGRDTTAADIARAIAVFPEAVARARRLAGALAHG